MDFDGGNWDVGKDAQELDKSLFQDEKKKKNKQSRKRKSDFSQPDIKSEGSVVKKNKNKAQQQVTGDTAETKDGQKNSEVPTATQLSRKEKREKIWAEKLLKRKLVKENGIEKDLGKTDRGSAPQKKQAKIETGNSPNKIEVPESGKQSSLSRFEKRKLKFEQRQKKKNLRKETKESENDKSSDTSSGKQVKVDKGVKDKTVIVDSNQSVPVVAAKEESQMNRKERKKLLWKQKLKERKMNEKMKSDKDSNEVLKKDLGKEKNLAGLNENPKKPMKGSEQKVKLKGTKDVANNETGTVEDKQIQSPKTQKTNSEVAETVTDSVKSQKKRKRKCNRNKFKGYVKPERKVTDDDPRDSETELKTTVSSVENVKEITTNKDTSFSPQSDSKQKVKKKKKNKRKNSNKSPDSKPLNKECEQGKAAKHTENDSGNKKLESPNSRNISLDHKRGKKSTLDPKRLKAMLSPDLKKITSDEDIELEKSENYSRDDKKENKPKSLLEKSRERLNAARFRYLNEQLYTSTGQEAFKMFKEDKDAFNVYHEGFQGQVEKWPTNPVDVIIEKIQAKPKNLILADFGCGDAKLARSVPNKVHSFDLVALNDHVTVCDMSKVPLKDGVVDIAVFCLSLMGTNLSSYLREANRILKHMGTLMIAEVTSRFDDLRQFVMDVEKIGFKLKQQDNSGKMFIMMEFQKTGTIKGGKAEDIHLKPCLYKKR